MSGICFRSLQGPSRKGLGEGPETPGGAPAIARNIPSVEKEFSKVIIHVHQLRWKRIDGVKVPTYFNTFKTQANKQVKQLNRDLVQPETKRCRLGPMRSVISVGTSCPRCVVWSSGQSLRGHVECALNVWSLSGVEERGDMK